MRRIDLNKKNKWKVLFFLLLGIVIAFIALFFIMINLPAKDEPINTAEVDEDGYVPFHLQTNKSDLNRIIAHYIAKEGLDGPIDYEVILDDEVELYGNLPVFSQNLEMKLTFEPEALDNGDVVLSQKSIAVGQLNLPVSYVLKFVRDRYQLPEGVVIQPDKEQIYVSLQDMKLKSDLKVKVDEFDLKKDDIRVTLYVPTK
ncbi:DUF2140 family protein [Bacillus infantis]|uniref:DUF2140 family protein n=1 Tax=Bacillus infantis TaxID=324767 RepID=A0A5D4RI13_9BACI|nr:YpmS family protein [Bacillus infantis]TYS49464.1 DUF2140 family protein [Bacillus infantis]